MWVPNGGPGGCSEEEVEGDREEGQVGPEGVVLGEGHVLLEGVMESNPVQAHTHLQGRHTPR